MKYSFHCNIMYLYFVCLFSGHIQKHHCSGFWLLMFLLVVCVCVCVLLCFLFFDAVESMMRGHPSSRPHFLEPFPSCFHVDIPLAKEDPSFKRDTKQWHKLAWKGRRCASISICRLSVVVLFIFLTPHQWRAEKDWLMNLILLLLMLTVSKTLLLQIVKLKITTLAAFFSSSFFFCCCFFVWLAY